MSRTVDYLMELERAREEMEFQMVMQRLDDVLEILLEGDLKVFKKISAKNKH